MRSCAIPTSRPLLITLNKFLPGAVSADRCSGANLLCLSRCESATLLEAVRALRVADPDLGQKPLLAKVREQQPDLGAGAKEVREALAALEAEGEPSTSSQGLESSTAAVQGAEKDDAGASTPSDVQARAAMLYLLWPTHCNPQSSCAGPWLGEHTNPSPNPDPNQVTRTLTLTLTLTHRSHLQHGPLRVPAGSRKR